MRSLLLFVDCSSLPSERGLDPQLFLSRKDNLLFPFPPFAGVDNDGEPAVLEGGPRARAGPAAPGLGSRLPRRAPPRRPGGPGRSGSTSRSSAKRSSTIRQARR